MRAKEHEQVMQITLIENLMTRDLDRIVINSMFSGCARMKKAQPSYSAMAIGVC